MATMRAIETRFKGHLFRSRLEARWAVAFESLGLEWSYESEGYQLPDGTRYLPDFKLPKVGRGCFVEIKPRGVLAKDEENKAVQLALGSGEFVMVVIGDPWPGEYDIRSFKRKADLGENRLACLRLAAERDDDHLVRDLLDNWRRGYDIESGINLISSMKGADFIVPYLRQYPSRHWEHEHQFCWCGHHAALSFASAVWGDERCGECLNYKRKDHPAWLPRCFTAEATSDFGGCDTAIEHPKLLAAFRAARSARFEHGERG